MASDSVEQKNPLFIEGKCFNDCEAMFTVGQGKTKLFVCKEYLASVSDYFRIMFYGDFKEKEEKKFKIIDEKEEDIISFFNAINPHPKFRKITVSDDSVELLMRMADKYQCDLLKERLQNYIQFRGPSSCRSASTILHWLDLSSQYIMPEETFKVFLNVEKIDENSVELLVRLADKFQCDKLKARLSKYMEENAPKHERPSLILNWLILSVQYHMSQQAINACLPSVACLSLSTLCSNKEKIGLELFAKLVELKDKVARCAGLWPPPPASRVFQGCCTTRCRRSMPECICDRNLYQNMLNVV